MLWLGGVAAVLATSGAWIAAQFYEPTSKLIPTKRGNLDVPYVPTHEQVVERMLSLAKVTKDDVVYDLGCGDGRIVVTAAKKHGARGVGVDIDPERIKDSNANAQEAGVTDKVKFVQGNLFKMDLKEATVVTLYLLPEINLKLRPKLFRELKPGTRIVSHDFDMGEWEPEQTVQVNADREHTVYFWTIPEKENQPVFKEVSTQRSSTAGGTPEGYSVPRSDDSEGSGP
jgi:SAM-dependent methyltransferase